jgi:hypothetical protein
MARRDPEEKNLGLIALEYIRRWGGVLEHPRGSKLWWGTGMRTAVQRHRQASSHQSRKRTHRRLGGRRMAQSAVL